MHVTNGIPRECPLLLPVGTVNYVETLKVLKEVHAVEEMVEVREQAEKNMKRTLIKQLGALSDIELESSSDESSSSEDEDDTVRWLDLPLTPPLFALALALHCQQECVQPPVNTSTSPRMGLRVGICPLVCALRWHRCCFPSDSHPSVCHTPANI
jgi:hypothetical protein